jgi:release factor glutamine methyltransferase
LEKGEVDALRTLTLRRGLREPLQYVVGSTSFCGFEIEVNKNVLIPRPETELLAERAWTFLKSINPPDETQVLDLCTGSGCLAIALAAKVPSARLWATDLSEEALAVARRNVERHQLGGRIQLRQGDGFAALDGQGPFDLMVSNPPYIPSAEIEGLDPEVRDFEPRGALDGGADGLDFYRRIAAEAGRFLKPGAPAMLELEEERAAATQTLFEEAGWLVEALQRDDNGKLRILIARAAVRAAG